MAEAVVNARTEERLEGKGGLRIFVRTWRPAQKAHAVVVIAHGFNSHSGQYQWVAEQLTSRGYAVYAADLRGRGHSDGERFYVESFSDYLADLDLAVQLAKSRESGLPLFLLGHSAGGVIASSYALEHQGELAGLVCESFAFQVPAPDFALAVIKGVSHLAPHAHVLRLHNEDFTRDPVALQALNEDPLIANEVQPTLTVAEMVRADERLKSGFPLFRLPLLILHGTEDRATKPAGSQLFHDAAGSSDKTLKLYPGHFHDLLSDLGKESVLEDVVRWMGDRHQ